MGQAILRWFGVFYLAVGLLDIFFHDARGFEFGVLNVNTPHSVIHAVVGLTWILASFRPAWTRLFGWTGLGLFAILIVYGIFPSINFLQWWVPLDGTVLWFHVLTFIVLLAVVATSGKPASRPVEHAG